MTILVIGGAGFIGSNLCKSLIERGDEVFSLDNYSTGSQENHKVGVRYISGEAMDIASLCADISPSIVFHLGEYSRVEQSLGEPDKALANTYQTLPSVLRYCREKASKLIYSGSSTKFSDANSPYSVAKSLNTSLVDYYMTQCGLPYAITYFYNAYGHGEITNGPYSTVVAKFIQAKKNNQTVKVTAPGTQRRNFTHVNDIVSGLIYVSDKGYGDKYGIGSDESFSIIDLCKMIGVNYVIKDACPANRLSSKLITSKTKLLGWKPEYSLFDYIGEQLNVAPKT
jgi:UDP-glucose 4-epimerase